MIKLNENISYDNGTLYWSEPRSNSIKKWSVVGTLCDGYIKFKYKGSFTYAHRFIWQKLVGEIPEGMFIDHINHDRTDNRIENLRLVSKPVNAKNKSMQKNNKSGFTGVHWKEAAGKWQATIKVNGKTIYLGIFSKLEDAVNARKMANKKYNFHKNHGESNV